MRKINAKTLSGSILITLAAAWLAAPTILAGHGTNGSTSFALTDGEPLQTTAIPKYKKKKKKKVVTKKRIADQLTVPSGIWGADGVMLEVKEKGVTIEYGCATGHIDQIFTTNPDGVFGINGTQVSGSPGPVLIGAKPVVIDVRYEGRIAGDTMTLKVTQVQDKKLIGEFTLKRGMTPEITRCY
ncbi:MAG: hypothetical protein ABL952_14590 [Pyrinomonadaceae bacterium]